jgi:hypothetical protein
MHVMRASHPARPRRDTSGVAQFTRQFLGDELDDFPDDELVPRAHMRRRDPRERAAWAVVAALACVFVVIVLV